MSKGIKRGITLRATLVALVFGAALYVAVIAAVIFFRIAPTASSLRRHSEALQVEFAAVRDRATALKTAFAEARQLLQAGARPFDAQKLAGARSLLAEVRAQLDDTRAIESARTLAGIPGEMRIALSRAADAESQLGVALIEVLSRIELGDYRAAAARLSYCDALNDLTAARLAEAQAAGLTDVIERQRVLGAAADLSVKAVAWWAAVGLALVPLLARFVQRRFYARLAALDTGLAQVAEGRLDTAIEVGRADELGRLSMHFNEMTAVLRQRAEEARRQSEEKFAKAFRSSPDAITITRFADGCITDVNDNFLRIFGYSRAEVVGRAAHELNLWAPEVRARVRELLQAQGAVRDFEFDFRRKTGEPGVALYSAEFIELNGERCVLSVARDITERKQAEEALRLSEEKFAKAFRSSPDSIMISRVADGRIIDINDNFERATGYSREEAVGRTAEELNLVRPEDRARMIAIGQQQGAVHNYEFLFHHKSGEPRVGLFSGEFLELGGELCGLSITRDITDRKHVEDVLENSLQQLRALSDHLQQVREEERTHIAREIHDELGQALTALRVDLSWLAEKLPPGEGTLAERIEAMSSLADSVIQTVQKIATELRPGILDNLGLTAAIEWQTEEFSSRTGIRCRLDCLEEIDGLDQARATACFRILQETLTNVARHAGATEVQVSLKRQAGSLMLQVRDNGRGISDHEITDRTAIGLLGMKERAHALGGEFEIKGSAGQGTTVTVSIPLT